MTTNNNTPKQTIWEIWFTVSVIILVTMIVSGTVENSKNIFPNWPIWAMIAFVNFCISLGYGLKGKD